MINWDGFSIKKSLEHSITPNSTLTKVSLHKPFRLRQDVLIEGNWVISSILYINQTHIFKDPSRNTQCHAGVGRVLTRINIDHSSWRLNEMLTTILPTWDSTGAAESKRSVHNRWLSKGRGATEPLTHTCLFTSWWLNRVRDFAPGNTFSLQYPSWTTVQQWSKKKDECTAPFADTQWHSKRLAYMRQN